MIFITKRKFSLVILGLTVISEGFCRYGVKNSMVFYLLEDLQVNEDIASKYMRVFAILITLFILPAGLITDFLLKQRKAVIIGLAVSAAGCFLLIVDSVVYFFFSLVLISMGLGLIRPNLYVLTGRLFQKHDIRRDVGFLFFFLFINIGGFFSPFIFSSMRHGWNYFFILAGIVTLAGLTIFYSGSRTFDLRESDWFNEDRENKPKTIIFNRSVLLIIVFILCELLFASHVTNSIGVEFALTKPGLFKIGDYQIPKSFIVSLSDMFYLPAVIIMAVYWYFAQIPKSLVRIGISFILLSIGLLLVIPAFYNDSFVLPCFAGMSLFAAFAELFLFSVIISYITRLSPVKYSSTIIAIYLVISHYVSSLENILFKRENVSVPFLAILIVLMGIIGILILINKKQMYKLAHGIE